jgi:serine/threonine-protein kinase
MPGDATPIGAVLAGKYEIRRLLGQGGMGAVYEGSHVEIGKRVAIKLLDRALSANEEVEARFRQEARVASRVESEHVVQVFDVGDDATWGLYMVMEVLVGEDLAARIEREPVVAVPTALEIGKQAARGLAKAHAAGVVHRDLKPGNIFLATRDDGGLVVKLVDFGISKIVEEAARPGLTKHGSAVGTPQYMSPEQAQGLAVDGRSDLWSLGAVLYEILSGRCAYELLENYEQTIFSIVLRKPRPLSEIAPWVPPAVCALVERAMTHDLDGRVPDAATFARMCEEAQSALATEVSRPAIELVKRVPPRSAAPEPSSRVLSAEEPRVAPATIAAVAVRTGPAAATSSDLDVAHEVAAFAAPRVGRRFGAVLLVLAVLVVAGIGSKQWLRTPTDDPGKGERPALLAAPHAAEAGRLDRATPPSAAPSVGAPAPRIVPRAVAHGSSKARPVSSAKPAASVASPSDGEDDESVVDAE